MLETFYEIQVRLSKIVGGLPKRYLYDRINFGQRLFGLAGARGVGKTTLVLQHLAETYANPAVALYISADHVHVAGVGLYSIAEDHVRNGGGVLCIDEVHKYANWAGEIKSIYDSFPDLRLIVLGSSALQLTTQGVDLSRRLVFYSLKGLSFREFLNFKVKTDFASVGFDDMLARHVEIAAHIAGAIKVFPLFREYLRTGYYPFWFEGQDEYWQKLQNVLDKIIYEDLPSVFPIRHGGILQLKRFLHILATSKPFQVNVAELARDLGLSRDSLYQYMDYLTKSFVLNQVWYPGKGKAYQRKPAKLYFENSNLLWLLANTNDPDALGAARETFFVNQMAGVEEVFASRRVDFEDIVGREYEVGGRSKTARQLNREKPGYLFVDDTEIGVGTRIPLYLLGFLY